MLTGLATYCTVFVMTTTRKLLQTRRKHTHRAVREWGKTMANMRELRCKRRKKTKKRPAYVVNQYTFTNTLQSGKLESSQSEVKIYLRETHSDSLREDSLGGCERLTDISSLRHVNQWYQDVSTLTCSDISPHILNIFIPYIYLFQPLFLRLVNPYIEDVSLL